MKSYIKLGIRYALFVIIMLGFEPLYQYITNAQAPITLAVFSGSWFFVAATAVFVARNYNKITKYNAAPYDLFSLVTCITAFVGLGLYTQIKYAMPELAIANVVLYLLTVAAVYTLSAILLAFGIFGRQLIADFSEPLILLGSIALPYASLVLFLRSQGQFFGQLMGNTIYYLLELLGGKVEYFATAADPILQLGDFAVLIGDPCSGVESLVLFTGLYAFMWLMDHEKYDGERVAILYLFGLIGMYLISLSRIIILMLIGAYWSPHFALNSFHSNAGWILFSVYFLVFMKYAIPILKK